MAHMALDPVPMSTRSGGNATARRVFAGLPQRYDHLAWLLSFGQDRRWRRGVVTAVAAASPARVLDVATGPAGVALAVAGGTGAEVVGVDLDEAMLRQGVENVRRGAGNRRVTLAVARAEQLPFRDGSFDAVSFSYLLRYVDQPAATVSEMARCLRPGGVMASLDFFVPPNLLWRGLWRLYTAIVLPVLGGVIGGPAWWRVGRFLGPNIRHHYTRFPLEWHVRAWEQAGLLDVGWRVMSVGGGLVMWGRKPLPP
jgi:demethylmenaquinone methyltransferase / 2-methoxy-6-polyprenyl-1,4-benzoquinol methylase